MFNQDMKGAAQDVRVVRVDYADAHHGRDFIFLLDSYARDPMGGGEALIPEVKDKLLAQLARRSFAYSWIAYVDDQPAGLINAFEGFSSFAAKPLLNVHDVIVLQAFRGLQLSQLLLQAVELQARALGCCKVTLEVLTGNKPAQEAYKKFGFASYELDPQAGYALFWQKKLEV